MSTWHDAAYTARKANAAYTARRCIRDPKTKKRSLHGATQPTRREKNCLHGMALPTRYGKMVPTRRNTAYTSRKPNAAYTARKPNATNTARRRLYGAKVKERSQDGATQPKPREKCSLHDATLLIGRGNTLPTRCNAVYTTQKRNAACTAR